MTPEEKEKLDRVIAKIEGKKKLHDFLRKKLMFINIILTVIWFVAILIEILNAVTTIPLTIDSELIRVVIIGIIGGIPIAFVAESIGIYRKWGVSVDVEEARDLMDGKRDNK